VCMHISEIGMTYASNCRADTSNDIAFADLANAIADAYGFTSVSLYRDTIFKGLLTASDASQRIANTLSDAGDSTAESLVGNVSTNAVANTLDTCQLHVVHVSHVPTPFSYLNSIS